MLVSFTFSPFAFSDPSVKNSDDASPDSAAGLTGAPMPTLDAYYANEAERVQYIQKMFARTAPDYDRMERILSLGSGARYRRQALQRAGLKAGDCVLDVAVGTGLVAREAVRIVGAADLVCGVDPSAAMMASAHLPAGLRLLEGRAEALPCEDQSFDFLSMGYALRHVSVLARAFAEFHRVLKPGAKICLLEITRPDSRMGAVALKAYMRGLVPALGALFTRSGDTAALWRYYWDTIEACAPPERVLATLTAAGFTNVRRQVSLGIFSEYQALKRA